METTTSADGTTIAFGRHGTGMPVVIVTGALSTSEDARPLAAALAEVGLQGVCYDRRGRGRSGDASPYDPGREVDDLAAVVAALDAPAAVFGHSAGAVLALVGAASGLPLTHLFASEPPLRSGADAPPADLAERLQRLVDQGERTEALLLFQRENVRLTEEQVTDLLAEPGFERLVELAHTTVHDTALLASAGDPSASVSATGVPVTVLHGDPAHPVLVAACVRLARSVPGAELVVVPESHNHGVDPDATARVVRERLSAGRP